MFDIALKCSIVAYVYFFILIKPGHILHWWAVFLEKDLVKETFEPEYSRKEHWLYKPLIGCELCFSGQLAIWSCVFTDIWDPAVIIITICSAILFTKIITGIVKFIYEER